MTQTPIDVAVNPNDDAQRYILWTNGRIDNVGGAPPITGPGWYDRVDTVAMALHITNWATGAGYVLDWQGGFNRLGDAPDLMTDDVQYPYKSVPGVPYQLFRCYIDWSWDPAGTGQGYVMDEWGQLYAFGGATAPPRTGPRFTSAVARKLFMQWSPSKKSVMMDMNGGLYADFGLATLPTDLNNGFWPGRDFARDLFITDFASSPIKGYTLDMNGALWPFGGAPIGGAPGGIWLNADVARTIYVLSVSNPTRLWQVWSGGQQYEYVFSNPPTVVAGGAASSPATTVTTTTRPTMAWSYADPQLDTQQDFQLLLFTQTFVSGHSMTDPLVWASSALLYAEGHDPSTRGVVPGFDLTNGTYRFYVRSQDSSGQWSAWSNRGWTQNITAPGTPTGMSAIADGATNRWRVNLSVSATAGTYVGFDYSDDGGATWAPVRGAEMVPRTGTTTAVDYDAPPGESRGYRAHAYSISPRTASAYSTAAYTAAGRKVHVLTSTANPALGGEIFVVAAPSFSRDVEAGVFEGINSTFPTVVSDAAVKSQRTELTIECDGKTQWDMVEALILAGGTLIFRDPFGEVVYCRIVGKVTRTQQKLPRYDTETTPLRHNHLVTIPLVQVAPPTVET